MKEELELILSDFKYEIESTNSIEGLESLKNKYLMSGGKIPLVLSNIKNATEEERPIIVKMAHEVKDHIEKAIEEKFVILNDVALKDRIEKDRIDIYKSSHRRRIGKLSSDTLILKAINSFFIKYGFDITMPQNDNIMISYINDKEVFPFPLKSDNVPCRNITINKLYNKLDFTLSTFIECTIIDKNLNLSNLKGLAKDLVAELFGKDAELDLRPNYSVLLSPSIKIDVNKNNSNQEFLNVMTLGMIKPEHLQSSNINPDEYNGFVLSINLEKLMRRL